MPKPSHLAILAPAFLLLGATGCNLFLGSSGSPGVIISFGDSITQAGGPTLVLS